MTWITMRRAAACAFSLITAIGGAGCDLLEVNDPTAIEEEELANASGADMLRRGALSLLYTNGGSSAAYVSGLLADEFLVDPSPSSLASSNVPTDLQLDRRALLTDGVVASVYTQAHETRRRASEAAAQLRLYGLEALRQAHIGQMFTVRGYTTLLLAEQFCPGFPLNEVVDGQVVYRPPLTTPAIFEHALAEFDSAVVYAADSAPLLQAAQVGRGRTLLGLGRFAEAGQAVATVPVAFVWNAEFTTTFVSQTHVLWFTFTSNRRSVADHEGGTGLDFVSADDPRVTTPFLGTAYDGVTGIYAIGKYPTNTTPIVLASGIEARLIEAEAALRAGQPQWLTILNTVRQTRASPALPDLADPGAEAARVDLLFREWAFWLFATGHRLGDLRRLIAHYGRPAEAVFPTGPYRLGGVYGQATSLPFPVEAEAAPNPAVTGCTAS